MKKKLLTAIAALWVLVLLAGCGGSDDSADAYKAGTYTSTAAGYGGGVEVEVEFDKDAIVSVKVIKHQETDWFAEKAIPAVRDGIIEKQTWEVEAFTSATMTSEAIKAAVKDCIEQAENK